MGEEDLQTVSVSGGIVFPLPGFQFDHLRSTRAHEAAQSIGVLLIAKRLGVGKGFCPIGRDLGEGGVQPQNGQNGNAALDSVEIRRSAEGQGTHIPQMGEVMLASGGGTGNTGTAHSQSGEDKTLRQGGDPGGIALYGCLGALHHPGEGIRHHGIHGGAIGFAGDDVAQFPLRQADDLRRHIADTGPDHRNGGGGKNIRVRNDGRGGGGGERSLQAPQIHGGGGGSKAVHGGSGRQVYIGTAGRMGDHLGHIVDDAAAHAQNHVILRAEMHGGIAEGGFVRCGASARQYAYVGGDPCPGEKLLCPLPGGFPRIGIGQKKHSRAAGAADLLREFCDGAPAQMQTAQVDLVLFSAIGADKSALADHIGEGGDHTALLFFGIFLIIA